MKGKFIQLKPTVIDSSCVVDIDLTGNNFRVGILDSVCSAGQSPFAHPDLLSPYLTWTLCPRRLTFIKNISWPPCALAFSSWIWPVGTTRRSGSEESEVQVFTPGSVSVRWLWVNGTLRSLQLLKSGPLYMATPWLHNWSFLHSFRPEDS